MKVIICSDSHGAFAAAEQVLTGISMVDQEVFLFDDTVRENIRHARPEATDAEIEEMNAFAQEYIRINNLLLESDYYGRKNAEK